MKVEMTMGCFQARAFVERFRWPLAIAFLLGLLAQAVPLATCFAAGDELPPGDSHPGDSQSIAALPENGVPPAPVSAVEAAAEAAPEIEVNAQALPGGTAAAPPSHETTAEEEEADSRATQADGASAAAKIRQLSVSPAGKPLLPEGHPSWVGAPPDLSNERRHRLFVGSFPTLSIDEVDEALDEPMLAAVNGYIDEQVLEGHESGELHITSDFIRHNLLDRSTEYIAELSTSSGPMYQKWVVLEITPEHRRFFAEEYRQLEQRKRIVALGLGLAGLLGITGIAHLGFNRRRRRYAPTAQPVVHTLLGEPETMAAKRGGWALWLIAACLGCLAVPFLVVALYLVADETQKNRTASATITDVGPRAIIHGEGPMPPTPPQPPEVYIEAAATPRESRASHELKGGRRANRDVIEGHEQVIGVRGESD